MSVLITGMDMPRHCGECGIDWCYIWRRAETPIEKRPPDCPLSEVPTPHGDLIDRDALMRHKGDCYDADGHLLFAVGTGNILRAPTIIPAEEGET